MEIKNPPHLENVPSSQARTSNRTCGRNARRPLRWRSSSKSYSTHASPTGQVVMFLSLLSTSAGGRTRRASPPLAGPRCSLKCPRGGELLRTRRFLRRDGATAHGLHPGALGRAGRLRACGYGTARPPRGSLPLSLAGPRGGVGSGSGAALPAAPPVAHLRQVTTEAPRPPKC